MKKRAALLVVIGVLAAAAAYAADDGQTQPRISTVSLSNPNTSADIIATTNGSGNVKGVLCQNTPGASIIINVYVNGGSAQDVRIDNVPLDSDSSTGWIPLNVRFTSSIRVQKVRQASPAVYGGTQCSVSWALD